MRLVIHTQTGPKGGIGKTINNSALTFLLRDKKQANRRDIEIVILDLNHTEFDSYNLFRDYNYNKQHQRENFQRVIWTAVLMGLPVAYMNRFIYDYVQPDATHPYWLYRVHNGYQPIGTSVSVWEHITNIVLYTKERLMVEDRRDCEIHLLVDTNMTAHSLYPILDEATWETPRKRIQEMLKQLIDGFGADARPDLEDFASTHRNFDFEDMPCDVLCDAWSYAMTTVNLCIWFHWTTSALEILSPQQIVPTHPNNIPPQSQPLVRLEHELQKALKQNGLNARFHVRIIHVLNHSNLIEELLNRSRSKVLHPDRENAIQRFIRRLREEDLRLDAYSRSPIAVPGLYELLHGTVDEYGREELHPVQFGAWASALHFILLIREIYADNESVPDNRADIFLHLLDTIHSLNFNQQDNLNGLKRGTIFRNVFIVPYFYGRLIAFIDRVNRASDSRFAEAYQFISYEDSANFSPISYYIYLQRFYTKQLEPLLEV